jgi:AmmeMemoRadiSam system protein A
MCHAPIVIPAIAGQRGPLCARTTAAMTHTAERLVAHAPDVIAIISPHTPRDRLRFGIVEDDTLSGDFGQFGAAELEMRLPGAPEAAAMLRETASARGLQTCSPRGRGLDHGALVPLHFVQAAGWNGPTLLLALPFPDTGSEAEMGRAIADAAARLGQRWCVLASGDMSHRLTQDAPAGYHPSAQEFDDRFCELIASGELERASAIDASLRELAAEDVVDSCTVAAAAVDFDASGHRVLSYEGPFGVGYLEAVLHESTPIPTMRGRGNGVDVDPKREPPCELLSIAREAIDAHARGAPYTPPSLPPPWTTSRGVFVTLRTRDGDLRGCIGHMEPLRATLAQEVATCAISSASRDTRFSPVQAHELEGLTIEISLLSPPEPITGIHELDPKRYGVVVSLGDQRGVLLPDIEGIDTARDQVRIARAKAGLRADAPVRLERFEVTKLRDADLAEQPRGPGSHVGTRHELN